MGTDWTGSRGEDPGDGCSADRPYGTRPYGPRPYGPRPYGPRPYGPRPYGPRSDTPRPAPMPYGPRSDRPVPMPYGPRPYGPRPYGPRGDEEEGAPYIDPGEWGADIAELFCQDSAVIRLGARVVTDAGSLSVLSTEPLEGTPGYMARSKETFPRRPLDIKADDWRPEPSKIELGAEKKRAGLAKRVLRPREHELAVKVVIPDDLARNLVDSPEIAWGLKQDIAHGLAVEADRAFLQGDPDGLAPVGIRRTTAVTPYPFPGDVLQIARGMLGEIRRREQVRFGNAGWVIHPDRVDALTRLLTQDAQQQGWGVGLDARPVACSRRTGATAESSSASPTSSRGPPQGGSRRESARTSGRMTWTGRGSTSARTGVRRGSEQIRTWSQSMCPPTRTSNRTKQW